MEKKYKEKTSTKQNEKKLVVELYNTLPVTAVEDSIAILTGMHTASSGIKDTTSFGDDSAEEDILLEEPQNTNEEEVSCTEIPTYVEG